MGDSPLVLGIDLGTSGIRTAVVAANGAVLDSRSQAYGGDFANPHSCLLYTSPSPRDRG